MYISEELKLEPITPDTLKSEKAFMKITKKHIKELETMRKKHQKERNNVQKSQCSAIEKLVKNKGRWVISKHFYSLDKCSLSYSPYRYKYSIFIDISGKNKSFPN